MSRDRQECAVVADGGARRYAPALPYSLLVYIPISIYYINFCSLYRHMLPLKETYVDVTG